MNGKVILKYYKKDIDNVSVRNGIWIDPRWRDGYFTLRKAEVVSICEGSQRMKGTVGKSGDSELL